MTAARTYFLALAAFFILAFGLAADLGPRLQAIESAHPRYDNFYGILLGDSRDLFANQFFVEADVYYHSGYYPTIFDQTKAFETPHIAADTGDVASHNQGEETTFMGPPRDWIDAFGRHFVPDRHTHLDEGGPTDDLSKSHEVAEILPWLKIAAELDPENIQTYVVTAFWLRTRLNQPGEALEVLRSGLRNNPGNPELLFELGRVYFENYHNIPRAREIWEAGVRMLKQQVAAEPAGARNDFDNRFLLDQLESNLGQLEEQAGNFNAAIAHWRLAKTVSPSPAAIQKHIDELTQKPWIPPGSPFPR